ncbi:MAG: hypothetical protein ACI9TH_000102 [Kiritimatiellia bacterium]
MRAWQLLEACQAAGWTCVVASAAAEHPARLELETAGFRTQQVEVNDMAFDSFVSELVPSLVVFDRFMTEEQFSWRVRAHAPHAMRVLDLVDLHALREARQEACKAGVDAMSVQLDAGREKLQRELAAMWRSDVSLVISSAEMSMLDDLGLPESKRLYCPLVYEALQTTTGYSSREHFVFIGNFRHPPNADAVVYLKEAIWPAIRSALPKAELHVYGAYPPRHFMDMSNPGTGFIVKGPARDLPETLARYRVCLAPLRFGAGLKGKILDSMGAGTPVVTSRVGGEGVFPVPHPSVVDAEAAFISTAVELYGNPSVWSRHQSLICEALDAFSPDLLVQSLATLERLFANLSEVRVKDYSGQAFWQQTLRSTEYFSRWITAKNQR